MKKAVYLLIVVAIAASSCEKFVAVEAPIDRLTASTVFNSDGSATSAVAGIYSRMMLTAPLIFSGGSTLYPGLSADELEYTGSSADIMSFNSNSLVSTNGVVLNDFWQRAYYHIYHINAGIEGLEHSEGVSAGVRKQLMGELYFLRAFSYFYLVNLFGDVPLQTSTDYRINAVMPRTSRDKVYELMREDLENARQMLSEGYPSAGRGRVNRMAARALLARVYLYNKNWVAAEDEASAVIGNSMYSMSTLANTFLATSTETIWQLVPVTALFNTAEGVTFVPASATVRPNYILTPELLGSFEAGDQRKVNWVKSNTVSGVQYNYPFKYKVRNSTTVTENYIMLRLAEQYLIRAEARAEQEKLAEAASDINVTRLRAGIGGTTANTKAAILEAVMQERRRELFAEWGHRWFDLKRTGSADVVLGYKAGWQSTDVWYPIPQAELLRNVNLVQNEGY